MQVAQPDQQHMTMVMSHTVLERMVPTCGMDTYSCRGTKSVVQLRSECHWCVGMEVTLLFWVLLMHSNQSQLISVNFALKALCMKLLSAIGSLAE
jgi:hypothetical protein